MPQQSRKTSRNHNDKPAQAAEGEYTGPGAHFTPGQIYQFLNALPLTGDAVQWIERFREALKQMLGDVDRIAMKVNTNCNLGDSEADVTRTSFEIAQHMLPVGRDPDTVLVTTTTGLSVGEQLIQEFRQMGHPVDDYHPPHIFDYYYEGQGYLGTILLLRERSKPPISEQTIEAVNGLKSFIIFALSDLVSRHYYARPINRVFNGLLMEMVREAGLSSQDMRIVSLMLLGFSYKQVADRMDVTIDTVRKHMKRIYRKTRTGSLAELFAKYFTPRLGILGLGEEDSL